MTTNNISHAPRAALSPAAIPAAVAAALLIAPHAAPAQVAPETALGDLEEIVVTGSRIARDPNATAPVPVQVIGSEAFQMSGRPDPADVLREVPSLFTSVSSESSIQTSADIVSSRSISVGQSILQLRGMGEERTLVLVDGRRHVAGVEGTQAVDIGSIPPALIDRVEVLTGGASALYGADAVTGVVNFIMKRDYEGLEFDAQIGSPSSGPGQTYRLAAVYGLNFDGGRGNVAVAADWGRRQRLRVADRDFAPEIAADWGHPDLRFQSGDIDPAAMPNFAAFYNLDTGRFPSGFLIPTEESFTASYADEFGAAPALTAAELALIERAANAPTRAILPRPVFSITSHRGVIAPGDFSSPAIDLDGDGVPDCEQSFTGFNSSLDFASAFGIIGGCWVVNDDGSVRPFQDGLIAGQINQFGGDGILPPYGFAEEYLIPDDDKVNVNVLARYDITPALGLFVDAKYGRQTTDWGGPLNTFYDLLTVAPDNPFIPAELQQLAGDTGGLWITRDPTDLGPNIDRNRRETYRVVLGLQGEIADGWNYEVSLNAGRFDRTLTDHNRVIQDRFFAAIDVTTDANGTPICRSDIDPTPPPTTPFDIPLFDMGFFTFVPGDGQCVPADILGGPNSISQEAVDFITTTVTNRHRIEQRVVSGFVTGDWLELPAGSIGFALGGEYRDERSRSRFDGLVRGELPIDGPEGTAGTLLSELDDFRQNSLVFDPATLIQDTSGSYDVWDVFGEVSIPILGDRPFARELLFDAAVRYSEYSTIGSAVTWKAGGAWRPVEAVRFRSSYSEAVRAPNIFELFDPQQGAFFRPIDPCDQDEIDALVAAGDPRGPNRQANCAAAGIPSGFSDPLTARFSGVTSGNPDVREETAETFIVGVVIQPPALPALTVSVDYWDMDIRDAISTPSAQDIVNACYDTAEFPNQFCELFTREQNPASPQFLGFNSLRQQQVNFGSIEATGVDLSFNYQFDVGRNTLAFGLTGTRMNKLDFYFDPGDPEAVDPELRELQRPRLSGAATVDWRLGAVALGWRTRYMSEQGLRGVEIEDLDRLFGPAGMAGSIYIHDLTGRYDFADRMTVYGGVNNVGDRKPFITERAYPVSPLGRTFFAGVTARF